MAITYEEGINLSERAMSIGDLVHAADCTPGGPMVLILNRGELIDPEAEAMLQALHSRSTGGIGAHLKVLAKEGSGKFMQTYYVGYGHKSIGDCGTTTVFVEGISMLAAKALQDTQLYSGQESSTRYIDFSSQPFLDPTRTDAGFAILESLRTFYLKVVAEMKVELRRRYPLNEGEDALVYKKAVAARAFDIARGFLPAGAMTNISWHGNLRQIADRLLWLRHHPLSEVRQIADSLERLLVVTYPHSFSGKRYPETEQYAKRAMARYYWLDVDCPSFALTRNDLDLVGLSDYREVLESRPVKTELPKYLANYGSLRFRFNLDFGSFRDLQRQRSVDQRMPRLTERLGFHHWYLAELTPSLREEAESLLVSASVATDELSVDDDVRQYYLPMGYMVSCDLHGDLPALVYVAELRATRFVHPTLSFRAGQIAKELLAVASKVGLVLHLDDEPDRFDIGRGKHDIIKNV